MQSSGYLLIIYQMFRHTVTTSVVYMEKDTCNYNFFGYTESWFPILFNYVPAAFYSRYLMKMLYNI